MNAMRWAGLVALTLAAACGDAGGPMPPVERGRLELVTSNLGAAPGGRIAVAIRADQRPAAVQGWLRYDPARLRYVGQPAVWPAVLVGADTAAGRLHIAAVQVGGLPVTIVTLVFEVMGAGSDGGLVFEAERVGGPDLVRWRTLEGRAASRVDPDLWVPADPRRLELADWMRAAPAGEPSGRPGASPRRRLHLRGRHPRRRHRCLRRPRHRKRLGLHFPAADSRGRRLRHRR